MKTRKSGFTLVEILIVVIILGILAAIIIPQFTDASTSAKESSLTSNLQTLRSQIGLYKIQHNDHYPSYPAYTDAALFETCLTIKTDVDGIEWTSDAQGTAFGPYMPNIPENPFISDDTLPLFTIGDGVAPTAGASHWHFDVATGTVIANDGGTCPDDVTLHSEL